MSAGLPFNNPDAEVRQTYYGVTGTPDVFFDGYDEQLGGGIDLYPIYKPVLDTHLLDLAKVMVDAHVLFDEVTDTGSITVTCEVAPGETITNPSECKIRVVIYEDDIFHCCGTGAVAQWERVHRDNLPDTALTIANSGEIQTFTQNFSIDDTWDGDRLRAIAFIQRDSNKRQLNAALATYTYDALVANVDPLVQEVAVDSPGEYDATITYTGVLGSDVTVTLDESALPPGWSAELEWNSVVYPSSLTIVGMVPSQVENVRVRTISPTGAVGLGSVKALVTPVNDPLRATTTVYHTFVGTNSILFVDDDNLAGFDVEFSAAIAAAGNFAVRHDFDVEGQPFESYLSLYDAVIWNTGELQTKTIGLPAQAELAAYLDGGGSLFLSSQGFLNHMGTPGAAFRSNYLKVAAGWAQDAGCATATGVALDPIGDGLNLVMGYPFADRADRITAEAGGVVWLNAPVNGAGIRYDSGTFKTVFMSAAFEGVSDSAADPNNQGFLMGRILDWLLPSSVVGVEPAVSSARKLELAQNRPNPFTSTTQIRFSLPVAGPARVTVYDVAGRRVADLMNRTLESGSHSVTWDGRDTAGASVASGVYLLRLEAAGETLTREIVRLK